MKIEDNKIYFLDDSPLSSDILNCITFCQKPDFTFKSLIIWTDHMYAEMAYDHTLFTLCKSIWILSSNDRIHGYLCNDENDRIILK